MNEGRVAHTQGRDVQSRQQKYSSGSWHLNSSGLQCKVMPYDSNSHAPFNESLAECID